MQSIEGSKETIVEAGEGCVGVNGKCATTTFSGYEDENHRDQWAHENEPLSLLGSRAAVFGHEFANSLTVISSSLQFVERELEKRRVNDSALMAVIQSALGEINRLDLLLNEFRSPAAFQACELINTDLVKVVEEVLALQMLICRAGGIVVKFEFEDAVPLVRLDAAKIKQVVLNLCKNAVEAMPQGGCLTLKVCRSGRTVVLEISDNGIGMPENLNKFELFKTTKPGGSGIGLSIVQQIVLAHNSTITCASHAGHGTTFRIVFPIDDKVVES